MSYNLRYVEKLPIINDSNMFLILESSKDDLHNCWFEYIQAMIKMSLSTNGKQKFKVIGDLLSNNSSLSALNSYAKNLLGIGDEFSVIDIAVYSGKTEIKTLMSFEDLVTIYFSDGVIKLKKRFVQKAIIDRFFAFMWSNKKLLYPIIKRPVNYQRAQDWKEIILDNEISSMLEARFNDKNITQAKEYQKTAIYSTLIATTWHTPESIKEDDLKRLEQSMENSAELTFKQKKYYTSIFNELRFALINYGRNDITRPRDKAKAKIDYQKVRFLHWVDLEMYPKLENIVAKAIEYPEVLKRNGLASATISGQLSYINNFIKYLMTYYPESDINLAIIDEMFEPENESNLFNSIHSGKEETSAYAELNCVIKFLAHYDLYSNKARKNTPKSRKKIPTVPFRAAMPKEMVRNIVDIIKHRPPNTTTRWSKTKCDSSWWSHDVYPVFPMMMLFGYYIPLRGEQVRNLCRQNSFVFNNEDRIETIVINTDKNVNRKHLQEIPCVWEDLQIFTPFLKWHKEYFGHIPKVMYHEDENSPWEEIEPLFITPQVLTPLSRQTHFDYHKRVLCQYQIEMMEKAEESGGTYPKIAWTRDGKPFFKNIEELNNCSSTGMNNIEVVYDLHSLRVTGATRYLESGVGLNLVMQLTGHMTPDTLTRIYINLTMSEKKEKLKSAIDKIYFGDSSTLLESTKDLLKGELVRAYENNKESLEAALTDNALFSLNRKTFDTSNKGSFSVGTDIALSHHPSTWFAMVHGICPSVKCPDGRENKCSLCPYLITGKLFTNGIALKANQALAKFQREVITKQEEEAKGYKNQALAENLEVQLEEILGWLDIIKKIEMSLQDEDIDSSVAVVNGSKSSFSMESIQTELAYLKNAYDAKQIGVEQDRVGLKILTIKAMKMAALQHDNAKLHVISDNEEEAIDYLMGYYSGNTLSNNNVKDFVSNLKGTTNLLAI